VWAKAEVQARIVLEFERPLDAISQAANHDERGHESDDLELSPKLLRIPDLAVLGF
jgi:hypothetical protein